MKKFYQTLLQITYLQHVVAMVLVQVVCSVQIQQGNVPAMLVTKVPSVMLLVVAIPLDQVVQHVMHQQVNVLAKLAILVLHAILAPPTIIEPVMELVQVRLMFLRQKCFRLYI